MNLIIPSILGIGIVYLVITNATISKKSANEIKTLESDTNKVKFRVLIRSRTIYWNKYGFGKSKNVQANQKKR